MQMTNDTPIGAKKHRESTEPESHQTDVERYVGWGCILNCFKLSSLPCFYAFCWSAIPTSCYIFNVFYSCYMYIQGAIWTKL